MTHSQQFDQDAAQVFDQVQETIARQNKEIEALKQQLECERFAQELRKLLIGAEHTTTILAPFSHTHVLEMVVAAAAQVISARSGSLFLMDEDAQDLVFEVAIGPAGQDVKKFRVPLGHGIAGMVAMTGQSMAIADTKQDANFAIDIATSVNYIPRNILCVPLFYDEHVIGALELLDKIDADTFSLVDVETLGQFANIAAVAIAQSQTYHDQQAILRSLVHTFTKNDAERRQSLQKDASTFLCWAQTDDAFSKSSRELAVLVHELSLAGEQEREMCKNVLQSFVVAARSHAGTYSAFSQAR